MMPDRYKGKPLLILLENYVLDCIGHFPQEKNATIAAVVQKVYGGGTDWKATLRATLKLEDALDDGVRHLWRMTENGTPVAPEEFARTVVDQNFAQLIEGE